MEENNSQSISQNIYDYTVAAMLNKAVNISTRYSKGTTPTYSKPKKVKNQNKLDNEIFDKERYSKYNMYRQVHYVSEDDNDKSNNSSSDTEQLDSENEIKQNNSNNNNNQNIKTIMKVKHKGLIKPLITMYNNIIPQLNTKILIDDEIDILKLVEEMLDRSKLKETINFHQNQLNNNINNKIDNNNNNNSNINKYDNRST